MSESSGSRVKATIVTNSKRDNKRVEKRFAVDVTDDDNNSGSHLKSLRNCVNRLETQLNQYLTQIIDDESQTSTEATTGTSSSPLPSTASHVNASSSASTTSTATTASAQPLVGSSQQEFKYKESKTGISADIDHQLWDRQSDGPKQKRSKNK